MERLATPDKEPFDAFRRYLDTHGIPHHTWTQQKTIEDLFAEIQAGETILKVNDNGELCRHVSVACVDVFSEEQENRWRLKEEVQEFNDGRPPRQRELLTSLGEKMVVGAAEPETPFAGARRALKEELDIDLDGVDMVAVMGEAQREEDSASYPGLKTVYTDHYFAVEVPYQPGGYVEVQPDKTTHFIWEKAPKISEETMPETLRRVDALLVPLATDLILGREDLSDEEKAAFINNLRSSEYHSPAWHRYDILTHSEKFEESLVNDIPRLAEEWDVGDLVAETLNETIDGVSKAWLMRVVAKVHDIGKFTARRDMGGKIRFVDHEAHSGEIVRVGLKETFFDLGFTEPQIEYIARCSELHFELGRMRRTAIEIAGNYTLAFARSEAGRAAMQEVIDENPDLAVEIALMFAADSLSKTEVFAVATAEDTDDTIELQRDRLVNKINEENLNPHLIDQALQMPVNLEVAKQFLLLLRRQHADAN